MKFFAVVMALFFLFACSRPAEIGSGRETGTGQKEEQYRKEMEEIKKTIKGEVKIKLKKDGKGAYTWEITGKDAQEVLKVNEALARKLGH
jgi:outer membrane biogenesis lipoprotein LolB